MPESQLQLLITFVSIAVLGLVVMIAGFRFSDVTRRTIETIGAITFHIGVFGVLYLKVHIYLFTSLVTMILSLFLLFDPLKLARTLQTNVYKNCGWIMLALSVATLITYFLHFQLYLWLIPIVIYLLGFLLPPLKKHLWLRNLLIWGILIVFFFFITVRIRHFGVSTSDQPLSEIEYLLFGPDPLEWKKAETPTDAIVTSTPEKTTVSLPPLAPPVVIPEPQKQEKNLQPTPPPKENITDDDIKDKIKKLDEDLKKLQKELEDLKSIQI